MPQVTFYRDRQRKIINPKLFSEIAETKAREIAEAGQGARGGGRPRLERNKRTQLRKFYDEVIRLNGDIKSKPTDWDYVLPYVNMLIAKAVYAQGRNTLVTSEFVNMLKECIDQVEQPGDLDVFANFFEAFMGYYKQYE
ncbi:MAG: type III-A CRISPR-associated protein Csm2 [Syntrophobacterales bacterium]|jgi:CRISPR-associated protein Csm2|nr:type III-A CRISPR-associated protein Csm2 [Syntrophobacterales bacterium]